MLIGTLLFNIVMTMIRELTLSVVHVQLFLKYYALWFALMLVLSAMLFAKVDAKGLFVHIKRCAIRYASYLGYGYLFMLVSFSLYTMVGKSMMQSDFFRGYHIGTTSVTGTQDGVRAIILGTILMATVLLLWIPDDYLDRHTVKKWLHRYHYTIIAISSFVVGLLWHCCY